MMDVKKDRLDYGRLLMPPPGMRLVQSVASTYSLDLHTLLAIPVALFYSKSMDGNFSEDRFDVFDSIEKFSDIVRVYCQKGRILVPKKYTSLFAFLEKAVSEVIPPIINSSFHPKVWVLRYEGDEEITYRVIVASRNMTFDRSWDVAAYFDGIVQAKVQKKNTPLIDFVKKLVKADSMPGMGTFLNDLGYAAFEQDPAFKKLLFHPIGIDKYKKYRNPIEGRSYTKLLIMSPFLDEDTLRALQSQSEVRYLFSRKEELDKIAPAVLDEYETYYLSDLIVEGEHIDTGDDELIAPQYQQLHAKLFIGTNKNEHTWFLGSANCTSPAFSRNIEFMAELQGSMRSLSAERVKDGLTGANGERVIFEEYHREADYKGEDTSISSQFRIIEYQLIKVNMRGRTSLNVNGKNYDLELHVDCRGIDWVAPFSVHINLLDDTRLNVVKTGEVNTIVFSNINELSLSRFIQITIMHKEEIRSFLLKAEIDLPEGRDKRIIKSIIDSQEKFFQYIKFLLDERAADNSPRISESTKRSGNFDGVGFDVDLPIFESLLVMASRSPEKLIAIDRMIDRLKEDADSEQKLIPAEFEEFWKIFKPFARTN